MYSFRMVFYPGINGYPTFIDYPKDNYIVSIWGTGSIKDAQATNKSFHMMVRNADRTISEYNTPDTIAEIRFELIQKDNQLFLTNIKGIEIEDQEPIFIGQSDPLHKALDIMKASNYIYDFLVSKKIIPSDDLKIWCLILITYKLICK